MSLTTEQLQALAADITANTDPAVVTALSNGDVGAIAAWYNDPASPDYYVWKQSVSRDEIMQNGFDWVRVDNLSVGKARIWDWMFSNANGAVNPTLPNIRAGISECWKGTAADLAVRAAIWLHCQRLASRAEKLFATGAGTAADIDGNGPGETELSGPISYQDVGQALNP